MTSAPALGPAYIVAARRTALGRPGGLHKSRRIEGLTSPVVLGEARVVVAGGGESLSTAPWRVARPKSVFQTPRFLGLEPEDGDAAAAPHSVTASETLARRLGIGRDRQDAYALQSHLKAERAANERRFVREIVPLR